MAKVVQCDICVIGAGSGGLSVAAGASQMGADVVLVERGLMGGDCLNYGCVPSKALIAAAEVAESMRSADRFGIAAARPQVDMRAVRQHVRDIIAAIEPNDSVDRFTGLGVNVIQAEARFVAPDALVAGDTRIDAKYFVVATGSTAVVPPIEGLADVTYLTNETVFDLDECPDHLIVIGGGPIGAEIAQAHRRLGAEVTVVDRSAFLAKDDPELTDVVRRRFAAEGIAILEKTAVKKVAGTAGALTVTVEDAAGARTLQGSHLLVAAGRKPNVAGLGLEAAGIEFTPRGISVDARLRTTNRRVFAIGDVTGRYQFTHMAGADAGTVIRNALFRLPAKAETAAVPWVTYTDPELAHVGMGETAATEAHGRDIRILRWPFHENDRAQAERATDGMIKVVTTGRGRILGATIVGRHAGELLLPWALAIKTGQKIGAMAGVIAPYPTLSEISKRAAGSYYTPSLFGERTKKLVRFLLKLPF